MAKKQAASASKEEDRLNAAAEATARRAQKKKAKGAIKFYVVVALGIAFMVMAIYLAVAGDGKSSARNRGPSADSALVNDRSFISGVASDAAGNFTSAASPFFNRWTYADLKYGMDGVNLFGQSLVGMPGALQYCKRDEEVEGGALPPSYDVREAWPDCVGEVYDSGNCSSSYATAAASSLSARFCIADNAKYKKLRLSAQQMLSCDKKSKGCKGGGIDSIWAYIQRRGLYPEECVPFAGEKKAECKTECKEDQKLHIIDHCLLSASEKVLKREIYNRGPVVVPLYLKDDYLVYSGGVYTPTERSSQMADPSNAPLLHAVTLLGWGKAEGTRYWIVGHSWGTGWGEKGYARVSMNSILRESYVMVGNPATEQALQQKAKAEEEEKLRKEEAKKERAARDERIKEARAQREAERQAAQPEDDVEDVADLDFESEEDVNMDENEM